MEFSLLSVLRSLNVNGAEDESRDALRFENKFHTTLALATNTALPEQVAARVKRKCRLVGAYFLPGAAITGTATDFFTLLIDKRTAATPGTPINLITYAADTPTTDDAAAFGSKDLLAAATYATYVPTATAANFDFEVGDVATVEVTKSTATGMTWPVSTIVLIFEPRTA